MLRYFWGVGCPFCEEIAPFIDRLEERYPDLVVERYEVFETREHHDTFRETILWYGGSSSGVPQVFFEEHAWIGYSDRIVAEIEEAVRGGVVSSTIDLPLFGTLSPEETPAVAITAAIAFVDGFNPCSLWVLTLLLGLIVHTRSRRRILLVGSTFLVVTAAIYGFFMLGLLNVFAIAGNTLALRLLVATVAVTMGVINVKDYFFFKQGVSLTIPERFRRPIAAGTRYIADTSRSWPGLVMLTTVFAGAIAIVELPCTAGFPVIWSRYVTAAVSPGTSFFTLLGLYLLVYLLLEVAIVVIALVTMGRINFTEREARPIKLLGGALMVSLGVFYVIDPEIAGTVTGVGRIFLTALTGASVLMLLGGVIGRVTAAYNGRR